MGLLRHKKIIVLAVCFGSSLSQHQANVNFIGQMYIICSLLFSKQGYFFKNKLVTKITVCADQLAYFQVGNDFKLVCYSTKLCVSENKNMADNFSNVIRIETLRRTR